MSKVNPARQGEIYVYSDPLSRRMKGHAIRQSDFTPIRQKRMGRQNIDHTPLRDRRVSTAPQKPPTRFNRFSVSLSRKWNQTSLARTIKMRQAKSAAKTYTAAIKKGLLSDKLVKRQLKKMGGAGTPVSEAQIKTLGVTGTKALAKIQKAEKNLNSKINSLKRTNPSEAEKMANALKDTKEVFQKEHIVWKASLQALRYAQQHAEKIGEVESDSQKLGADFMGLTTLRLREKLMDLKQQNQTLLDYLNVTNDHANQNNPATKVLRRAIADFTSMGDRLSEVAQALELDTSSEQAKLTLDRKNAMQGFIKVVHESIRGIETAKLYHTDKAAPLTSLREQLIRHANDLYALARRDLTSLSPENLSLTTILNMDQRKGNRPLSGGLRHSTLRRLTQRSDLPVAIREVEHNSMLDAYVERELRNMGMEEVTVFNGDLDHFATY